MPSSGAYKPSRRICLQVYLQMLRWYNIKNKMKEAKAMETAKRQMLREPGVEPTDEVIAAALGEANDAYLKFINRLKGMEIELAWR